MARIRTIKPEFPQSESIGKLSRDARLLYIQLWTIVDDAGRARAASRMLASLLYPYDDDAPKLIDKWLTELEHHACIRRYEIDGSKFLDIPNWLKHQKIDRPSPSRLPAYREPSSDPRESSRVLDADLGPRTMDQEADLGPENARSSALVASDWPAEGFETFWSTFPNKVGKADALKAYERAKKRGIPWSEFWAGLLRYVNKTDDRPWCNPATWLNQDRCKDQPASVPRSRQNIDPGSVHEAARNLQQFTAELASRSREDEQPPRRAIGFSG